MNNCIITYENPRTRKPIVIVFEDETTIAKNPFEKMDYDIDSIMRVIDGETE